MTGTYSDLKDNVEIESFLEFLESRSDIATKEECESIRKMLRASEEDKLIGVSLLENKRDILKNRIERVKSMLVSPDKENETVGKILYKELRKKAKL